MGGEPLFIGRDAQVGGTPFEAFDTTKPTLVDLDRDGDLEIVAHNDNNRVYVLDAVRGRVLAELETEHPPGWKVRELNDVAVGDVDADGRYDLIVANSAGRLTRFELDPFNSTADRLAFTKVFTLRVDPRKWDADYLATHPWVNASRSPTMDGGAYLADVDRDGDLEIFVQTDGWPGHFSFDGDGNLRWMTTWSDGNSNPWVDDLDGDGRLEAVFVTDGGRVYVYDAREGWMKGSFHAGAYGADPGSISISPAFGDIDGDGVKEIVFASRQAVEDEDDPDWMAKQTARIFAIKPPRPGGDAVVVWSVTYPWLNPHAYTHPVLVDGDGDGGLDVVSMDWNTIGHNPGEWEVTGRPNLFALDGKTGESLWRKELESPWNNKDLAVADVDGDGSQEIVLADPRHGVSGLTFRDLRTGAFESHVPYPAGWGGMRGPVVADVDGDGRLDVVQALARKTTGCTRALDVGCREGAFLVTPLAGERAVWGGRFTFDHTTERAYAPDAPAVPSVVVRPVPGADLAVEVTANVAVLDVEARTAAGVEIDLDRSDGDLWTSSVTLAPDTPLEIRVETETSTLSAPLVRGAEPAPKEARPDGPPPERDRDLEPRLPLRRDGLDTNVALYTPAPGALLVLALGAAAAVGSRRRA